MLNRLGFKQKPIKLFIRNVSKNVECNSKLTLKKQILQKYLNKIVVNILLKNYKRYRVSQKQNSFKSLLPYIVLDIKDFLQFISLRTSFPQTYFTLK